MATALADLVPMIQREVNPPGMELFPDAGAGVMLGYLEDAFWDVRLSGMLEGWTVVAAADVALATPPASGRHITDVSTKVKDLDRELQMLIVLFAGLRIVRLKIVNLAVNFKAKAGPVEYEQQASATTLRAVLDSLSRRVGELKLMYSENYQGAFNLFDGELQRDYAVLNDLAAYTVG